MLLKSIGPVTFRVTFRRFKYYSSLSRTTSNSITVILSTGCSSAGENRSFFLSDLWNLNKTKCNNGDQLAVALSLLSSATTTTSVTASRVVPLDTVANRSGSSIWSRHRHSFTIRSPMHIVANCLVLIALWSIHRPARPFRRCVA